MLLNKIAIAALALLALGLLAAGCGGGNSSGGEDSIDKASFIKQADEICNRATGRMKAGYAALAQKEATIGREKASELLVTEVVVPELESELTEIRALGLPSEGGKEAKAFVSASQKTIDKFKANPAIYFNGEAPIEAVELAGARFGLSTCPIAPPSTG